MKKKFNWTLFNRYLYWIFFGLITIAIACKQEAFENTGQWIIAILISVFAFNYAGDKI